MRLNLMILAVLALPAAALAQAAPPPATPAATGDPAGVDWFKEFGVEKPRPDPVTGEIPVAPYAQADANAGTTPFAGPAMAQAFGGQPGIHRLADRLTDLISTDPRIKTIFVASDLVRLRRTLYEQFCYVLNAGCSYSGRDMRTAHAKLGIRTQEMNVLVEDLQAAMREQHVAFAAQNRFLSKLAPMKHDVVTR